MKRGRNTLYRPEMVEQVFKLCLLGAYEYEIAEFFGVSVDATAEWKEIYPTFKDAIRRGRLEADANVASRLYERALGCSVPSVKIFMPVGAPEPVYAAYTEHYPPDTQAATVWLQTRQRDKWPSKQQHEHSGPDGRPMELTLNERKAEAAAIVAAAFGVVEKDKE